jgi:dethiobiotin synthetase
VNDLARCTEEEICDHGVRLEGPWSPHLSARLAGVTISVKKTLDFIDEYRGDRFWIIEGAGGPLVPLGDDEMMIDLMAALHLPIIVVARSTLGTINHTLLSLEAIRNRGLNVAGVVMNGEPNGPNREAIEHFGDVKVIAEIPPFENPLGDSLRVWTSKNSAALQIFGEQSRF